MMQAIIAQRNWRPSGMAVWLDATVAASITSSGGAVSAWADQSGNGRNYSQGTAGAKPTTGAATLNGFNVLTFDGGDSLALAASNVFANVSGITTFAVAKATTASGTGYQNIASVEKNTVAARATVYIRNGGIEAGGRRLDADSYQFTAQGSVANNTWAVLAAVFNCTNARLFAYTNGTGGEKSSAFQTAGSTSNTNGACAVGASSSNAGEWLTGAVAEVIIYARALSLDEVRKVNQYLAIKYNLPLA